MTEVIYVLSWYTDGSGKPQVRFFDAENAVIAVRHAAEMSKDGMNIECGEVVTLVEELSR